MAVPGPRCPLVTSAPLTPLKASWLVWPGLGTRVQRVPFQCRISVPVSVLPAAQASAAARPLTLVSALKPRWTGLRAGYPRPAGAVPVQDQGVRGLATSEVVPAGRPDVRRGHGADAEQEAAVSHFRARAGHLNPADAVPVHDQRLVAAAGGLIGAHSPRVGGREGAHRGEPAEVAGTGSSLLVQAVPFQCRISVAGPGASDGPCARTRDRALTPSRPPGRLVTGLLPRRTRRPQRRARARGRRPRRAD